MLLRDGVPGARVRAEVLRRRRDAGRGARAGGARARARTAPSRAARTSAPAAAAPSRTSLTRRQLELKRARVEEVLAAHGLLAAGAPRRRALPRRRRPLALPQQDGLQLRRAGAGSSRGEDPDAPRDFALGLHPRGHFGKVLDVRECHHRTSPRATRCWRARGALARELGLEPWDMRAPTPACCATSCCASGRATGEILVDLVTFEEAPERVRPWVRALLAAHPEITTLVQLVNDARRPRSRAASARSCSTARDRSASGSAGSTSELSSGSFFQTNTRAGRAPARAGARGRRLRAGRRRLGRRTAAPARWRCAWPAGRASVVGFELGRLRRGATRARNAERQRRARTRASSRATWRGRCAPRGRSRRPTWSSSTRRARACTRRVLDSLRSLAPRRLVYVSCNVTQRGSRRVRARARTAGGSPARGRSTSSRTRRTSSACWRSSGRERPDERAGRSAARRAPGSRAGRRALPALPARASRALGPRLDLPAMRPRKIDPRWPKYPPQPRMECPGFLR